MGFFATIMFSVLFLQDTKRHTYELLHTKPISAGKYVLGKVSAGFLTCTFLYTRDSGFLNISAIKAYILTIISIFGSI